MCCCRERAWVGPSDDNNLNYMQGTVTQDTKINAFGCFNAHSVSMLHFIEGVMNKELNLYIIQMVVKSSIGDLFRYTDYMFMQYKDPKYTAKAMKM